GQRREPLPPDQEAQHDPRQAQDRAQHADDGDGLELHRQRAPGATLRTRTAVTLNSGSFDAGSTWSETTLLISSRASQNAAKTPPRRGDAGTRAVPRIAP